MARSRNIKPGFFKNENLVELPFETRLLFAGLWTLADRDGRLEDRPKKIKMEIFPADSVDIEKSLSGLSGACLILRYTVDGKRFIWIPTFLDHQNPHHKEQESVIPKHNASDLPQANTVQAVLIPSSLIPSSLIPDSLSSDSPIHMSKSASADVGIIFEFWKDVLKHPTSKLTPERKRYITARLKDGYTVEQIKSAILGCQSSPHHMGENERATIYDDLTLICRSGSKLEQFIGYGSTKGNGPKEKGSIGRDNPNKVFVPEPPCSICGKEICLMLHRNEQELI